MNYPVLERAQSAFIGRAAYALALVMVVMPLSDIALGLAPLQFGSIRWRVGATGLVTGALLLPVTGLFLALTAAHFLQHRRTQFLLTAIAGIGAIAMLVALVFFTLDTLQLRNDVNPARWKMYDRAAIKGIVSQILLVLLLGLMSIGGWRASRAVGRANRTNQNRTEPVVVGKATQAR